MGLRDGVGNEVKLYLEQIEKIPAISKAEENFCAREAAKGSRREIEKLIVSNLKLVISIAVKYKNLGLPFEDIINEGNMGLIWAATEFDVKNSTNFVSYARWWIRHYILKAIFEKSPQLHGPVNFQSYNVKKSKKSESENSLERSQMKGERNKPEAHKSTFRGYGPKTHSKSIFESNKKKIIENLIRKLTPNEQNYLISSPFGTLYNLTKEKIRHIEKGALEKLRYSLTKKKAMDYV